MKQIFSSLGVIIRAVGIGIVALSLIIGLSSINSETGCVTVGTCDRIKIFTVVAVIVGGMVALVGHFMLDTVKGRFFTKIGKEK